MQKLSLRAAAATVPRVETSALPGCVPILPTTHCICPSEKLSCLPWRPFLKVLHWDSSHWWDWFPLKQKIKDQNITSKFVKTQIMNLTESPTSDKTHLTDSRVLKSFAFQFCPHINIPNACYCHKSRTLKIRLQFDAHHGTASPLTLFGQLRPPFLQGSLASKCLMREEHSKGGRRDG